MLIPFGVSAQSLDNWVLGSGGASSVSEGMQLSWTLGETNVASVKKNKRLFTEGFHQSYIEVREAILFQPAINNVKIQVFPNPAADHVQLDFGDKLPRDFELRLLDLNGKLLHFQEYQSSITATLNLGDFPPALYLISIQIVDQMLSQPQTFQIIKY